MEQPGRSPLRSSPRFTCAIAGATTSSLCPQSRGTQTRVSSCPFIGKPPHSASASRPPILPQQPNPSHRQHHPNPPTHSQPSRPTRRRPRRDPNRARYPPIPKLGSTHSDRILRRRRRIPRYTDTGMTAVVAVVRRGGGAGEEDVVDVDGWRDCEGWFGQVWRGRGGDVRFPTVRVHPKDFSSSLKTLRGEEG